MTTQPLPEPPERLSDLIELAINDGSKLDPAYYEPRWNQWHWGWGEGPHWSRCAVCLAGAVIAGTLHASPVLDLRPGDFGPDWQRALMDLEEVRRGNFGMIDYYRLTFDRKRLPAPEYPHFRDWPSFERHLESLKPIVAILREHEC